MTHNRDRGHLGARKAGSSPWAELACRHLWIPKTGSPQTGPLLPQGVTWPSTWPHRGSRLDPNPPANSQCLSFEVHLTTVTDGFNDEYNPNNDAFNARVHSVLFPEHWKTAGTGCPAVPLAPNRVGMDDGWSEWGNGRISECWPKNKVEAGFVPKAGLPRPSPPHSRSRTGWVYTLTTVELTWPPRGRPVPTISWLCPQTLPCVRRGIRV